MTDVDEAVELAKAVERLRILYEQYFAGVERFEPLKERDKVKRELRRMMTVRSNNTAYRFRLQTLQATLVTHEAHWDRIARQIEEGTFKRDKLKAQRHLAAMRDMTNEVELLEDEPVHEIEEVDAFESLDASDALSALEADDGSAIQDLLTRGLLKVNDELGKPVPVSASAGTPAGAAPRPAAAPTSGPRPAATATASAPAAARPATATAAPPANTSAASTGARPTPANPTATPARGPTPAAATAAPRPAPSPAPVVAATPRPAPAAASGPATATAAASARAPAPRPESGPDIKKLHEAFAAARSQTGEKAVSMETLAETVRKQTAAVKAQLNCENVEFKVAIKDGKAVLKAVPSK